MSEVIAKNELLAIVNKIEKLETDKQDINQEIKDVYADAKNQGFDVKALKQIIKLKKMKRDELIQQDEMLELYREVLNI
ncbi:DUF2312 domain-containing protein [Rickettsiales endosymbiont of Paramecium tredecaurelia]|uniref:DUF2312 domain-containing protein n=1 Tax=Candidatus Sarmatiella mevalonica TaxID=2770581 RepID=UPI001924C04D|nr:GapR family DNA-binding domain-containing protein [Candidatus Sarmatiella mevalonica]MBL3284183.1 DUF2312 domain-containing protein [Candidatus Sarmatiella mevalonica]